MRNGFAAFVLFCLVMVASRDARAFDDSTRRPFYVQGIVGSYSFWASFEGTDLVFWHPDVEFGYHFTGRHDGFVLGIRQGFNVGRDPFDIGQTELRGGYDFAIPLKNGRFEITIAPYATFGLDYLFRGPQAGLRFAAGIEGKLFFIENVYVVVRAIELSAGEFVDLGPLEKNVYFNFNGGVGAGFAF